MEYGDYLRQLDQDVRELLTSMVGVQLATPVSACPGWSLGDLGFHLAEGYQHKVHILRTGVRPDPWPPATPPRAWRAPVLEFLETSAADFLSELHRRDSDQRCWTWYPEDQTAGFWARRMAHETVIHRWDAEHSFQQPTPIATEVAADAIDELLVVFLSGDWSDDPQQGPVGNVDVVSGSIRWRVSLKAESVGVVRSQLSRGDEPMANAQLEGAEQTLLLSLWGRPTTPPFVAGDAALIKGLLGRLSLVTK